MIILFRHVIDKLGSENRKCRTDLFGEFLKDFQYLGEVRPFSWISMPTFLKQLDKLGMGVFWDHWPNTLQRRRVGESSCS
jgi:hypothetical protein